MESAALSQFHQFQNEHTQGWWLYLVTTRWFAQRVDLLLTVFLAVITFASIPLASGNYNVSLRGPVFMTARALAYCLSKRPFSCSL